MIDKKIFMLCESITEKELNTLNGEYLANIKYDGERVMSLVLNGEVIMFNRRGKIVNFHFREVERELQKFPNCILDGEIISFNNNFEELQSRALTKDKFKQEQLEKKIPVKYMIFDILKAGEKDLTNLPLKERLNYLPVAIMNDFLEVVEYDNINNMIMIAEELKCEGVVIKDMNSKYESRRSKSWLKLKFFQETTLILTSYTINNAGIRCESNDKQAVQVSGNQAQEVRQKIDSEGQIEVFIQYLTKTKNGFMRFPSFRGVVK